MERLRSIDEFHGLCERLRIDRGGDGLPTIVIPAGTCGQASGANDLIRIAKRTVLERGLGDRVRLRITGCHGYCQAEPSVLVEPQRTFYPRLASDSMARIVEAVVENRVLEDLLFVDPATGRRVERQDDVPFFAHQRRRLIARNEGVDPIRIFNAVERGGYTAFVRLLESGKPEDVIDALRQAGLRGRGGAGFPTWRKWTMLAEQPAGRGKFLVCNADEGDPGAYMDRSLLEGNPHSILEGMLIGAFTTRATEGVVYVRAEYPLVIKHLTIALRQARELGLLGADILGTGFDFDVSLVRGAGAFVCGEETALIASVEGRMGEPRQRPPFPVQRGIDSRPTVINNVETWANVPVIVGDTAPSDAREGSDRDRGTKIFSLVGKIANTGLVEVPIGTPIADIVYGIGGGSSSGKRIKAVQTGGPSGGCIPASRFDLPIDYDSLKQAGSIMGSGGMIVMDVDTCMVDVAKYFMNFLRDESCGKCFTCRKGTQRMHEILEDIGEGRGTLEQIDLLEELAEVVRDTSMCGLGQSAANPVLSTLRYFRDEYRRHVVNHRCDAFVCSRLVGAPCQTACPLGTEAWRYVAHIARGEVDEAYRVIRETNPFPSVCARACDHPCEERCRAGTSGGTAVAIRALKRFVTDRADPAAHHPARRSWPNGDPPRVAVIGAGPAGLTAAHRLSLAGCRVTVFEADAAPGGMLFCAIPSYRLPREVVKREIDALLDDNIEMCCSTALGRDITVDGLFGSGYGAVLLAMGAHKSRPLALPGEDAPGVFPSIEFLKSFNIRGEQLAKGRVAVIGGGNSAIDAARTAMRQRDVESVTILYRRTRHEMPAFQEEIDAAIEEGIALETLVAPTQIGTTNGVFSHLECVRNTLGDPDASGRRSPVPIPGSEFRLELDTLIVAISEDSGVDAITPARGGRIEITDHNTVMIDRETMETSRYGVFAAGDVTTGPNTIVQAIAAGRRAAEMIELFLLGEPLEKPATATLPRVYVEPPPSLDVEAAPGERVETPRASVAWRRRNFAEVEVTLSPDEARREAGRCLRCDLEFTRPAERELAKVGG
ncbi:MAG TPA: NADH-ubiquinone oxidoreductase-F iron-sulfur binding region domain-containing protein [Thermoanaerobaculales bacterium]|nr:NADH-ubiquinone oxidoreductase-F iron-sulfur binding region domain-containing protein [Thermoanaerobaculales bacterium]HQN95014.1 NADH-ubiquinone oxidoreductase-F iron-sulfur binding region domain-containing protein [Thermoanaerobaculales bacterium]